MSPLGAGVALLAAVLPLPVSSVLAGRLSDRYDAFRLSLGGLLFNGSALLWIGLVSASRNYSLLIPPLILWGLTLPFQYAPTRRTIMNSVPEEKQGQASGINHTSQLLGGTIGMAVCSAVLARAGDFRPVFLIPGCLSVVALAINLFSVKRTEKREAVRK